MEIKTWCSSVHGFIFLAVDVVILKCQRDYNKMSRSTCFTKTPQEKVGAFYYIIYFLIFTLEIYTEAKERYRGMFEIQKSANKTSSGEIGLDIRAHESPKVGQDQVSGGVSVLCWHAAPVWRRWDVATQERKVCNMENEIVTFVVKGSAKLTVPTDWQEQIQVGSRSVALRRVYETMTHRQWARRGFVFHLRPNLWLILFDRYVDKFWGNVNLKSVNGRIFEIFAFENSRKGGKMVPYLFSVVIFSLSLLYIPFILLVIVN